MTPLKRTLLTSMLFLSSPMWANAQQAEQAPQNIPEITKQQLPLASQPALPQSEEPQLKAPEAIEPISIDRIFSAPSLKGEVSKHLQYAPDGKSVTYLKAKASDQNRYDLWQYRIEQNEHRMLVDSASIFAGKEELSDEEKARRERQRVYGSGIMEYVFSNDGNFIVFPINGDLYLYDVNKAESSQLTNDKDFETDVKFSPKGGFVSFIKNNDIYTIDIKTKQQKQLTTDGSNTIKNGMAEFVAQEEMDRMTGYWWSPNEKNIAFIKVDESPVDVVIRNEIYADEVKLFEQRYPAAGTNNVKVSLRNIKLSNMKVQKFDLGDDQDIYLARVKWLPNSKTIAYQWLNRQQDNLQLRFQSLSSRSADVIIDEKSTHWINIFDDLTFINNGKQFIWASERDGFKHLYLYSNKGKELAQLTKGKWVVNELVALDEQAGWLYFTSRADSPLEKHLYKTRLDGSSPEHVSRVSKKGGFHQIKFANDKQTYIDTFSNINTPEQISLRQSNGKLITYLLENKFDETHPAFRYKSQLVRPTFGSIKANDGTTDLFYKLYKPQTMVPGKKYPVIVKVYGGPHAQRVTNTFSGVDMIQYMISQGYVVFQLDNRGSNYRGTKFEFAIHKQLGEVELQDQLSGVQYLKTLPFVDKDNIGVYGHSYGGYMALMAMFKAGDVFKAGVSGAPVTDWSLYDTAYTERYLAHPKDNQNGYDLSSVMPYAKQFDNSDGLFIYHGMADDNVLFTNTTKLIKVMQDENKLFDLMTYPGSKHSMRGKKVKVHLNNSIMSFFDKHLKATQ